MSEPSRALDSSVRAPTPSPAIPIRERPNGPITEGRLRRALGVYLVVAGVGLLPSLLGASDAWRAFGLGLVLPGGTFLYFAHPIAFALALVAFALSLPAWLLTGAAVVPPLVWLAGAVHAPLHAGHPTWPWASTAVPALALVVVLVSRGLRARAFREAVETARRRNVLLETCVEPRPVRTAAGTPAGELSAADLEVARYVLDRVLQPLDRFDGFDVIDQAQSAALRYQLNFASYALSLMQHAYVPAFRGVVSEGQRNAILKMCDRRVWEFWRLENLLGNLDPNPDPIRRDDIMYSGFLGVMIGLHERASGEHPFDAPGSLELRWSGERVFRYDARSLADAIAANFAAAPFHFYPCEPHWMFTVCNSMGMNALLLHDAAHGTSLAAPLLPSFLRTLDEEMTSPDGRLVPIRNALVGFRIPTLMSTFLDAATLGFLHPIAPGVAERSWEIIRAEHVAPGDGPLELRPASWDGFDDGNYTRSEIGGYAGVMLAAREMGDEAVYARALATVDQRFAASVVDGERSYPCSNRLNLFLAMARFSRTAGIHDLIHHGTPEAILRGPILAEAPYPGVLVARATSDGRALELVLRPGEGGGRYALELEQLVPGGAYRVEGGVVGDLVAGKDGRALVEVDLADRLAVRVAPR